MLLAASDAPASFTTRKGTNRNGAKTAARRLAHEPSEILANRTARRTRRRRSPSANPRQPWPAGRGGGHTVPVGRADGRRLPGRAEVGQAHGAPRGRDVPE